MSAQTWVVSCWDEAPWLVGPFTDHAEAAEAARVIRTAGVRTVAMQVEPWQPERYEMRETG